MKSRNNIRAGQLIIETRARFHDERAGRKVPRAGIIEETSAKKARIFFYIGPDDPLEIPLERVQSQWKEWDGTVKT
jgi:hypothetical protein